MSNDVHVGRLRSAGLFARHPRFASMNRRFNKAYLIIPVFYLAVLFALVMLQFSGTSFFADVIGTLGVRGAVASGPGDDLVSELTVDYKGVAFSFSADTPLLVRGDDSGWAERGLIGYRSNDDRVDVQFEDGISLSFVGTDSEPLALSVEIGTPDDSQVAEVSIPIEFSEGTESAAPDLIRTEVDGTAYALNLPPKARLAEGGGRVILAASPTNYRLVYEEEVAVIAAEGDPAAWFANPSYQIGDSQHEIVVDSFIESAYRGWDSGRYNSNDGTWDARVGAPRFHEVTLVAYLAEAWERGREEYLSAFSEMRAAADRHVQELTLASSPFLGDLRRVVTSNGERQERIAADLGESISQQNTALFLDLDLARTAFRVGGLGLYERLLEWVDALDLESIPLPHLVGLAANALLSTPITGDEADIYSRLLAVPAERVFPSIVKIGDSFFLPLSGSDSANAEGEATVEVDVLLSLRAGLALIEAGRLQRRSDLSFAGKALVASVLELSDERGLLPARVWVAENTGETIDAEGSLGPERFYAELSGNPHYPRAVIPYPQTPSGFWIWTIVEITDTSFQSGRYAMTVNHPPDRTYYIVMSGIPTTANDVEMELFGIRPWRNDAQFEIYSRGRYFDPATRSLLVKYDTRETTSERIVVDF